MPNKKIFKSLKVKNIYLKSIKYIDNNSGKEHRKLNISRNIEIESHEEKNVCFLVEHKVLLNKGENIELLIQIGIQIEIDINKSYSKDVNKALEDIAEKIVDVNYVDRRVSLLVANITSSLGDMPIFLPESFIDDMEN